MSRQRRTPYGRPDARSRAAQKAGYPARSVFKLEEIDRRVQLFRRGQRVLDLGAAPGSWSAFALKRIGPSGRLLAVDRNPLTVALGPTGAFVGGDVLDLDRSLLAELAPYDVVLSDMAPNTSGDRNVDQWRSFELWSAALDIATAVLAPGGSFVGKLFMGASFEQARAALRQHFRSVRIIRPEGTRSNSYEIFLVGVDAEPAAE